CRSSWPIMRPTCCAIFPTRPRPGKTCASPGAASRPCNRAPRPQFRGTTFREESMRKLLAAVIVLITAGLAGCGYNDIQRSDEQVKSAWSEVLNQYQRRADLIPNLVNTVKGFAAQEQQVLLQVTEARSRAGSIQATPELLNDEAAFRRFEQAQAGMTSALSRLLAVAESYPQLKSDANFRDLQAQLEGTENRIAVARNRYIKAVQEYNVLIRQFPVNLTAMLFGYQIKPSFSVEDEKAISKPPTVDFAKPGAPAKRSSPHAKALARPRRGRRSPLGARSRSRGG